MSVEIENSMNVFHVARVCPMHLFDDQVVAARAATAGSEHGAVGGEAGR